MKNIMTLFILLLTILYATPLLAEEGDSETSEIVQSEATDVPAVSDDSEPITDMPAMNVADPSEEQEAPIDTENYN